MGKISAKIGGKVGSRQYHKSKLWPDETSTKTRRSTLMELKKQT
jgi:hypothetical protein